MKKCIKPPRNGYAWLDACNRKTKVKLLYCTLPVRPRKIDASAK